MGLRTAYTPGTFCWVELNAADAKAATDFYSAVLGWQVEERPSDNGTYYVCRVDGASVAGIFQADPAMAGWMTYVSCEDADQTAKQAEALGATSLNGVFDVEDLGRMAVLQDPQGGIFSVWQAGSMAGAERVNDPGALTLTQLNTQDPEKAQAFYAELFGWNFEKQPGDEPYWGIFVGKSLNAGMMPNPAPGPDHWLAYFTAKADLEEAVQQIEKSGGAIAVPITQIGSGRITVATDAQGVFFALFEGRTDD
jgi:predicted enzyme related to lactoylglutathione lyase